MRAQSGYILSLFFWTTTAVHAGCSGGDTSPAIIPATFGGACEADTDCKPGLRCITSRADDPTMGGGPASGYCSKSCTMDSDCADDTTVRCVVDENWQNGICLLTCTIGPALTFVNDPLDPKKCNGRNDVSCTPADINTNLCLPTCGGDSQCPLGRVCDPRLTVCVDKASTGKPTGAPCDPKAKVPECAGICAEFVGGATTCTSSCVLGGDPGPTMTPNCGGVEHGYCLYWNDANGAGDIGFCAPACNKHDDCQAPSFWCRGIGGFTGEFVANGYCMGTAACPKGQSDCKSPNETCTPTKFGPFCLDPTFPLGSNEPD